MPTDAELVREANRVNYRLRSTFFLRKLKEYGTLSFSAQVNALLSVADAYNWDSREEWGIGQDAFAYIIASEIEPLQVFCHPKLLREHPHLLAYYRNVAALPQKAVQHLIGKNVKPLEVTPERARPLSAMDTQRLATLINEHVTLIIDSSLRTLTPSELHGLLLVSTGAQIDGSWRNAIGEEAERVVRQLLINEALERSTLFALIPRVGSSVQRFDPVQGREQIEDIRVYRGFQLTNQTSVLFSSEPDVSLIGTNGDTLGVIEVKGGADPAGALERYGAAKKSFEDTLRDTLKAKTILVASCITAEVETRIKKDATISVYYNLTQILGEKATYDRFMSDVFSLLGLP